MGKFPWYPQEEIVRAVTDYQSQAEVERYDARMRTVRDVDAENAELVGDLEALLPGGLRGTRVLEIGTGTGAFARRVAPLCGQATALDVSAPMLAFAQARAEAEGLANIRFEQRGFLGYDYPEAGFDAVVSSLALHHLPDVWKAEALVKIFRTLKPGGVFLLVDVIFDCEGGELDEYLIRVIPDTMDPGMKTALHGHIAREFSTFRWILEGIATRAGFEALGFRKFWMMAHLLTLRKPPVDGGCADG